LKRHKGYVAPMFPLLSQCDMTRKMGGGSWGTDSRCDGQIVAFCRHLEI